MITALKARDRAHTAGFFMTEGAMRDEARDCLDSVALYVMGALDVAARVANQILGLNTPSNSVGWQKREWIKKLPSAHLKTTAAKHRDTINIVATLRNTIHHKAMHIGLIKNAQPEDADYYVVLPSNESDKLEGCLQRAGGREAWGIQTTVPGQLWADPFVLIDQMITEATKALDDLLRATPFGDVLSSDANLLIGPPTGQIIWGEHSRRNIRAQLGGRLKRRAEEASQAPVGR